MEEIAAEEPEPALGWLLDNLAGTQTKMFALLLEAWASEPTAWADFPYVPCPALVICGETKNPPLRTTRSWPPPRCLTAQRWYCPACGICRRSGAPTRHSRH